MAAVVTSPSSFPDENIQHKEAFLETYWGELSKFGFDKAKELADREKESSLKTCTQSNLGSYSFKWAILTAALSQLATAEKAYLHLAFLAHKGFLRKDSNLKTMLESIRHDLKKIADTSKSNDPQKSPVRMGGFTNTFVAQSILLVIKFRLEGMEFYEKLSLLGTAKNMDMSDLLSEIEHIAEKLNERSKSNPYFQEVLKKIIPSLRWECEIIISLLKSHFSMQLYNYLEATIALQKASTLLHEWSLHIVNKEATKKSSMFKVLHQAQPSLYEWIHKLKGSLVAKYTLYFFELLAKHSSSAFDIKTHSSKLGIDYYSKIAAFHKKTDAASLCIIFDARDVRFVGSGYKYSQRECERLEGMDQFPTILAVPTKPITHWPNVIMILTDRQHDLNGDKLIGFFDKQAQATYFLYCLDLRMYLLIVYECRKSERDGNVQKFMTELAQDLKGRKVFADLKSS